MSQQRQGAESTSPRVEAAAGMMHAMGALERAAWAFQAAGDEERARAAQSLMLDIQALDPNLHVRVYNALPADGEPAERVETIAERVGHDWMLVYRVLELMRYPFNGARQAGGWWRRTTTRPER